MTAGGRRHDMIIVRFEDFLESIPTATVSGGDTRGDWRGGTNAAGRLRASSGDGPNSFLALRRMHLVRRALREADPSTNTVTRVATDHGFWNLDALGAYRGLFGESPSDIPATAVRGRTSASEPPVFAGSPALHH